MAGKLLTRARLQKRSGGEQFVRGGGRSGWSTSTSAGYVFFLPVVYVAGEIRVLLWRPARPAATCPPHTRTYVPPGEPGPRTLGTAKF